MRKLISLFTLTLFWASAIAQLNIQDLRDNFNIGQTATVSGIVTNDGSLGSVRYIQDDFAGIAIYPGPNWDDFDFIPVPGDEITVTGEITEFNGLLEIGPDISELILESQGNILPEPQLITPDQMDESFEGELVSIVNCVFDNGGAAIQGNSTFSFSSGGEQGTAFFRSNHPLIDVIIPISPVTLVGVASQFTFDGSGGYQILPRTEEDFILDSSINLVSAVEQENISQTGFDLLWSTDVAGDATVQYGTSPALGEEINLPANTTDHLVSLSDLEPGTIYYAKVLSSDGENTAESGIQTYATVSESSGEIITYFTKSVDTSFATIEEAQTTGTGTNDTLANYINRAEHTIDCAVYNFNDQTVVNALNDAYDRGVQIRYIAQGTNANLALAQLNDNVPVWQRMDDNGSGMHNKFMIVDADYTDKAVLLTGSTNWTTNNLVEDYNNIVIFKDQSIARGFRVEFEEMWGSTGDMPNPLESKFSAEKSFNTPVKYIIGGSPVEVYFSPTDNVTSTIAEALLSANANIEFALLAFTRDDLAEAVIDRNNDFFVTARGMIEQTSGQGGEFEVLEAAGVNVYSHEQVSGSLHHKYAIVDHSAPDSDPLVITGSHNWSSSAENVNDENTVIIHDERVANLFFQEFMARWSVFETSVDERSTFNELLAYPNPCSDQVFIENTSWKQGSRVNVEIFDLNGRIVSSSQHNVGALIEVNTSHLESGIYQLRILGDNGSVGMAKLMKR